MSHIRIMVAFITTMVAELFLGLCCMVALYSVNAGVIMLVVGVFCYFGSFLFLPTRKRAVLKDPCPFCPFKASEGRIESLCNGKCLET